MSDESRRHEIVTKRVVYTTPGTDRVTVQRDLEYRTTPTGVLTMDLYRGPETTPGEGTPAVILVTGYPDPGVRSKLGCSGKDIGASVSWGRLIAAAGILAITYTNREPAGDLQALLEYVRHNAGSLGIDDRRIGLFASSGNVPLALSALIQDGGKGLRCAVLTNGYMLDLDGLTGVAEAATTFGFVNPAAGKSVEDLPADVPLFIVRSGQDQLPHLNDTIDRFLLRALAGNRDVTFVNHAKAPHAFDLFHDGETSRAIIRQMLAFMQSCLTVQPGQGRS